MAKPDGFNASVGKMLVNTWLPPLPVAVVGIGVAALAGFGIGALRPLGRRSELLLLPFAPWLFVGLGPLLPHAANSLYSDAAAGGFAGLIPPVWLSIPALFLTTLFFRGQAARRAAAATLPPLPVALPWPAPRICRLARFRFRLRPGRRPRICRLAFRLRAGWRPRDGHARRCGADPAGRPGTRPAAGAPAGGGPAGGGLDRVREQLRLAVRRQPARQPDRHHGNAPWRRCLLPQSRRPPGHRPGQPAASRGPGTGRPDRLPTALPRPPDPRRRPRRPHPAHPRTPGLPPAPARLPRAPGLPSAPARLPRAPGLPSASGKPGCPRATQRQPTYPPSQGYPPAQPGYQPPQGYPPAQPGYQPAQGCPPPSRPIHPLRATRPSSLATSRLPAARPVSLATSRRRVTRPRNPDTHPSRAVRLLNPGIRRLRAVRLLSRGIHPRRATRQPRRRRPLHLIRR